MNLADASRLVRERKASPVELTQECLRRIERLDPKLNAFITVTAESALEEARAAERDIQAGRWNGPLHGIPIGIKDLVDTAGVKTTAGSALYKDRIPSQDAEMVRRLKAAGAVLLGKLNLHEFAYGGTSAISHFGPVRNPWNTNYSPGGSSGGSAAAVAAGLCFGAIGTDTGGSIREPAAYCGIVGLKPTYGSVSAEGVIPLSPSFDHVGPMARTVEGVELMLEALADKTPRSSKNLEPRTLRVGIPRDYFFEGIDEEIQSAAEAALSVLKGIAPAQREIGPLASDGSYASLLEPYTTVLRYEAYAYHQEHVVKHPDLYHPATRKRILSGAAITPNVYAESRRQIDLARGSVTSYFEAVDLIVTPTTAVQPRPISELLDADTARPVELQMLRNTRPFNALGLPTISVPCGFSSLGLPIGLQITGLTGREDQVLALAHAYEQATEWHGRSPF